MDFALLVLATPSIGPPPNVGPLKPEPDEEPELELELELEFEPVLEFEDGDPADFESSSSSEELLEELLELPLAADGEPELAPGCAPNAPCASDPPCAPPNPPCPGVAPSTGPLFRLMSC